MADDQWKTPAFRQKVVSQIEDAIQQGGQQIQKSSADMENFVFHKAKTKEEYLALVAKVILHARGGMDARRQQQPAAGQMQQPVGPPGMGVQPGMGQPSMMGQQMVQPGLPQDPINALQNLQQNIGPGQAQMAQLPNQMAGQMPGGQGSGPMARPPFHSYSGNLAAQPRVAMNQAAMHNMPPGPALQQVQVGPSSVGSVGGPSSNQPAPSPASSAQMPSPAAMPMVPSPSVTSYQNILSPAGRQQYTAPSPGPLNTPGNPNSVVGGSPAVKTEEDKAYLEKLQQLSKFIEPLKCLIQEYEKDAERKKDTAKFRSLLEILSDPNKRVPMQTLLKCEQALEKHEVMTSVLKSQPPVLVAPVTKQTEQHMCQPLLDAVAKHVKSPLLNNSLKRTFGPAVEALCGLPIRAPSPPPKKVKTAEEKSHKVPNLIQGEIARLGNRFHVDLDPLHHKGSKDIHLVCSIEDRHLPSVPPINLTIPENYPDSSPSCETDSIVYDGTPFLQAVHKGLSEKILKLPNKYSVTHLLDTWEMSIRQACATAAVK